MLGTGTIQATLIAGASIAPCVWLALVGFRSSRLLLYGPLVAIMFAVSGLTISQSASAYWVPIIILNTWVPQILAVGILRHHDRRDRELFNDSAMNG